MSQSAFTCITCHVAFVNADSQRHHYKSDWHRYNLKRKVVGLPPVTVDDFQQRAATQQAIVCESTIQFVYIVFPNINYLFSQTFVLSGKKQSIREEYCWGFL